MGICHQVLEWEAVIRYRVEFAEQVWAVWGCLGFLEGPICIHNPSWDLLCHPTACFGTIVPPKSKSNSQGNSKFIKTTAVCPYYISTGMFSGVASKIIPILDPDFVASSVVDATLSNKEIILLPWWSTYLFMLKVILQSWTRLCCLFQYFDSRNLYQLYKVLSAPPLLVLHHFLPV